MKRTRRDRGELEDIMFKLFERQPNWALKQLVQETDQPAVCLLIASVWHYCSAVVWNVPLACDECLMLMQVEGAIETLVDDQIIVFLNSRMFFAGC